MPEFAITYAYDVPEYADMKIEAATTEEALAKAQALLAEGKFSGVVGKAYIENLHDERVFLTHDEAPLTDDNLETLPTVEELLAQQF